jgi:DNA-binding NtrC family response regulator
MENCPWCGKSLKPQTVDLKKAVEATELHLLTEALELAQGNQTKAAELLNIPFHSIRFYIKKHGLGKEKSHPTKKKSHVSKKGSE